MKKVTLIVFGLACLQLNAQTNNQHNFERRGFFIGAAAGASALHIKFAGMAAQNSAAASFPNFKIGTMISKNTALLLSLPGAVYKNNINGRKRDRGFEAIVPSVQYWPANRLWLSGGFGLGMDAPAFYDIKEEGEAKFYFGTAAVAGMGYEIWRKGRFAIDLQARYRYGTANRPEGKSKGYSVDFLIGINFY